MLAVLLVGVGGFFGSICRYLVGLAAAGLMNFPLSTLLVNAIGCGLAGVVVNLGVAQGQYLLLMTGFCGGFTTFSAFAADSYELSNRSAMLALSNVGLNLGVSFACFFLGGFLATKFISAS